MHGSRFAAVAASDRGNVTGTQFHPEKSGETGLRILGNFVDYARAFPAGPDVDEVDAAIDSDGERPPASD